MSFPGYYKLDYYDVSQEVLSVYLQKVPDSLIAINLKACNIYRLFNGRSAEMEIRSLVVSQVPTPTNGPSFKWIKNIQDSPTSCPFGKDLLDHNMVIFRNGEGALQVLPALSDVIPEARLNLVIHHLRQDEAAEAYNLMQGVEPTLPSEYILKGIVHAVLAQETNNVRNGNLMWWS